MEVKRKIKPGEPGTLRYMQEYAEKLVCVRYRYDKARHIRFTTIELIVNEQPWYENSQRVSRDKKSSRVYLKIFYRETELRDQIKNSGGHWDKDKRLWLVSAQIAKQLGLQDRIVVQ